MLSDSGKKNTKPFFWVSSSANFKLQGTVSGSLGRAGSRYNGRYSAVGPVISSWIEIRIS
jgi:hypothetical protein